MYRLPIPCASVIPGDLQGGAPALACFMSGSHPHLQQVRDLLSKDNERSLEVVKSTGHVKDLTSIVVKNEKEITKARLLWPRCVYTSSMKPQSR